MLCFWGLYALWAYLLWRDSFDYCQRTTDQHLGVGAGFKALVRCRDVNPIAYKQKRPTKSAWRSAGRRRSSSMKTKLAASADTMRLMA